MKTLLTSAIPFLAALSLSLPCRADVIYSNLGPYDAYPDGVDILGSASGADFGVPGGNKGNQSFSSGGDFLVTSLTVGVDFYPPGNGFSPLFNEYIYSNVEVGNFNNSIIFNEPGTEIAEIGQAVQAPNSPGLVTLNPPSTIYLSAGSLYWAVLTPNNPLTFVVWDSNSLQVDGTLLTPEPATLGLLACALAGLITIQRTRIAAKQR